MRTTTMVALSLGTAGAVLMTGLAWPAGADQQDTQVLHLIDTIDPTAQTDVDLGAPGPSAGDEQLFRDLLSRGGKQIGTSVGVGTVIDRTATTLTAQIIATVTLPKGQLILQGAFVENTDQGPPATMVVAITGGTGRYRHAHGQCTSTFVSEAAGSEVVCTFRAG